VADPVRSPVPPEVPFLGPFVAAGVFGPLETGVVATYARLVEAHPDELLALAVAVRGSELGHVCVRLGEIPRSLVVEGSDPATLEALDWPTARRFGEVLGSGRLTRPARSARDGVSGPVLPLVLDGDRLYVQRQWADETTVVEEVRSRLAAAAPGESDTELEGLLDEVFGPEGPAPDRQRLAAAMAVTGPITVISGGPGTGKTRTVARTLALAHLVGRARGRPPRVALAAPTGKAAARMGEAVAGEIQLLDLPEEILAPMAATPHTTIHRLLGAGPTGFRRDATQPLLHDMVIVDEVSMVSLPLMTALLAALRRGTRLVLVGDPYQLASVEVGALLADMVEGAARSPSGPLAARVVTLDRVHRFGAESGIARLAGLIRGRDPGGVLNLLEDPAAGDPTTGETVWIDPAADSRDPTAALVADLVTWGRELVAVARDGEAETALGTLARRRVLCAHRRGPSGVDTWNGRLEQRVLAATDNRPTRAGWYPGRPVMVTRNDHRTDLFNGDTGVAVVIDGELKVAFEGPDGPRLLDPGGLPEVVTVWAMTIHKSQGSEFGHPVVVLPDPPSPLLNRELFYTGVTRARSRVTVVASRGAVEVATSTAVVRASGLAERLSGQP